MGSRRNFGRLIFFLFHGFFSLCYCFIIMSGLYQKNKKDIENFNLFIKPFKNSCNSGFLINNLKNHSSYPQFGSVNSWKKFCVKLNSTKDPKDFLYRNLEMKILSSKRGLLTGYYEPLLHISYDRDNLYKHPILKKVNI